MKTFKTNCSVVVLVLLVCSCGLKNFGDPVKQDYPIDGVKLISPSIQDQNAPEAMRQARYTLNESSRLLLRFEDLKSHAEKVRLDSSSQVELEVTVTDVSQSAQAIAALHAYPITRDWMMLATWEIAHPFGAGQWGQPGGDLDLSYNLVAAASGTEGGLRFNVTPWFNDFVKGHGENYGLALVTTGSVEIYGDTTGAHAPRLIWQE